MTLAVVNATSNTSVDRARTELIGGWEVGLLVFMGLLYLAGIYINSGFFGRTDAVSAILRDASRYGVMAVGMTFVIVNKDLDLSVGSIYGLVATVFSISFAQSHADTGIGTALALSILAGLAVGLVNGLLVTILRVPAFIATLTMLFIGRGFVLGLTGGKSVSFVEKARESSWFFSLGETNAWGFNTQILVLLFLGAAGTLILAKTRWGYETYATGGNDLAASYCGIPTQWVRIRAYVISALCATVAGLMAVAQDKGITSQYGQGAELIVIASVIVGGASILGGRGRVVGSLLGAVLIVLIDKVLREGVTTTRVIKIGNTETTVQAIAQLPPGAVPAFLGVILLAAVLIEPWLIRRKVLPRLWALVRGRPVPPVPEIGGVALVGVQTRATIADEDLRQHWVLGLLTRRSSAAVLISSVLWLIGLYLRPDFWGSIDNTFNLMLAFTEIGLLSIGLTFVIANADIDLSVGSVLALSGSAAAFVMKQLGHDPLVAVICALLIGAMAGVINATVAVKLRLPAFVATLGMFYMARGFAAWLAAGRQLSLFPENFNLIGRKLIEVLRYFAIAPQPDTILYEVAAAVSVQTIFMLLLAIVAGLVLGFTVWGQMIYATGGNRRAADYSGINTDRVRFVSFVFSGLCAAFAGVIYAAYFRSFNPQAGELRELDAISAVIIGGGSIFGGYGSVLGSIAGAAVIALMRALLSLQIITASGPITMPQHWVNVFVGLILIIAVLGDIWARRINWRGALRHYLARKQTTHG